MQSTTNKDLFRLACVRAFFAATGAFVVGYAVDLFVNLNSKVDPSSLDSISIGAFCACATWVITMPVVYFKQKKKQDRLALITRAPRVL